MTSLKDLYLACAEDPQLESELFHRPLRGIQNELIKRVEQAVSRHDGSVVTIISSRQTGKNETSAILQRRHLWRNQTSRFKSSWIRTAPTHEPQIVNSKKRLDELMRIDRKNIIHHPLFHKQRIQKSEGYIYRYGNATVEFMSSGPHANVVGATASECLDMDEAHTLQGTKTKSAKDKFEEDFMPFTASTNAVTLLWGVARDGMDIIEWYRNYNKEEGREHLNLYYPCEVWMEEMPWYAKHVEERMRALGEDHPIIKTQYKLQPVAQEGTFLNSQQARSLFDSEHDRELSPRAGKSYEILIDLAAGNEDFNPEQAFSGYDTDSNETTSTDSTVVWVYRITNELAGNNLFPVLHIVNCYWWTGVPLPKQEEEIKSLINHWNAQKVTVDGVGVGRQIAESLEQTYGKFIVNNYIANPTTISEDCFDLLARLTFNAVKMFRNDGSLEWSQLEKQVTWTKYASNGGKMTLVKPGNDKHIDMVKALTYIRQNKPQSFIHTIISNEAE